MGGISGAFKVDGRTRWKCLGTGIAAK
jgi:hypothetical protein